MNGAILTPAEVASLKGATMNTEKNPAYDYAVLIKKELIALDTLLEHWSAVAGEELESVPEEVTEEVLPALAELEMEWPTLDTDFLSVWLNETCLEVTVLKETSAVNNRRVLEILRTSGGPRCDITRDTYDSDFLSVIVHDGADTSTLRVSLPSLADSLDDIAECHY